MGVGARRRCTTCSLANPPRRRRSADAAGHGQPLRGHGRPAGHAPARSRRGRRVDRRDVAPTSDDHVARPTAPTVPSGTPVTITGTATDSGGGVVAGVEVSTDGGRDAGTRAIGPDELELHVDCRRVRTDARSESVPSTTAATSRSPPPGVTVSVSCPCTLWSRRRSPRRRASSDTKAVELGVKFTAGRRRLRHRYPLLQGRGETRHPHRQPLDATGNAARASHLHRRDGSGWQQVSFDTPGRRERRHDIRRLLLRARRRATRSTSTTSRFLTATPRSARSPTQGGNGVFRYAHGASSFPDQIAGRATTGSTSSSTTDPARHHATHDHRRQPRGRRPPAPTTAAPSPPPSARRSTRHDRRRPRSRSATARGARPGLGRLGHTRAYAQR